MHIKINGEDKEFETPISVQALADLLNLNLRQVAIELNHEIVSRTSYAKTLLAEGDEVEVVRFIGGG